MKTLGMMSIVLATIAIPLITSRDRDAGRGVRWTVALLFAFNTLWLAYLILVHATFHVPMRW